MDRMNMEHAELNYRTMNVEYKNVNKDDRSLEDASS
jgi:hypothetical protein